MRISIVAVGRLKPGPERDLVDRFVQRIGAAGRAIGLPAPEVAEIDESRARRAEDRRAEEARLIGAKLAPGGATVALDERGRDLTSEEFARLVARCRDEGRDLAFVIGGADGLDPEFLAGVDRRLRFGAMTLPHQLVRVLLAEQLYRATTILTGHPYHRSAGHRE